ncbi:hypothetical protein TRVL_08237 [Trypanosoma vivax]|nr:hypothetical protein TRVL_08237 [Trypanosoma vivax]
MPPFYRTFFTATGTCFDCRHLSVSHALCPLPSRRSSDCLLSLKSGAACARPRSVKKRLLYAFIFGCHNMLASGANSSHVDISRATAVGIQRRSDLSTQHAIRPLAKQLATHRLQKQ